MSEHTYVRVAKPGGFDIDNVDHVDADGKQITLASEIKASFPGKVFTVKSSGLEAVVNFDDVLTAGEVTTLDGIVAAHKAITSLTRNKNTRIEEIDAKTEEIIANGFTFDGKVFSLSQNAQIKMIGTHEVKDSPALAYPILWNTKDDLDTISIDDATELDNFYLTGVGTVRAAIDSGTALKDQIRAAATQGAIDLVIDNR